MEEVERPPRLMFRRFLSSVPKSGSMVARSRWRRRGLWLTEACQDERGLRVMLWVARDSGRPSDFDRSSAERDDSPRQARPNNRRNTEILPSERRRC